VATRDPVQRPTRKGRRGPGQVDVDASTRDKVLHAAVACILEQGFYRASTNEIARRAGVTWGVLQHHFGTREGLMVALLHQGADHFYETVSEAHIDGDSAEERIDSLLRVLSAHYGSPEYLAYLQILLNLEHDPDTSDEIRQTMRDTAQRTNGEVRRLLREALGSSADVPDLAATLFLALRGFSLSQQLLETMAYDAPPSPRSRVARQRRLLVRSLASLADVEPDGA
jgi:AcrR family transcriptional regulator